MSQFQRGREAAAIARQTQELRKREAMIQPQQAIAVWAVNQETQEKKLVGVAMSDGGADQLLSTEAQKYPGCKFYAASTIVLLV